MKNLLSLLLLFSFASIQQLVAQKQQNKPKLIVGIIIDQMRSEYLYRFQENYTEDGFKRLMRDGFNVRNAHYNYVPTATGPGHASVYTGTTPENHGIVSNSWYSRELKRKKYCAEDSTVFLVDNSGIEKGIEYKDFSSSPKNVKTTTITDELKLVTNKRAKVIGLSLKDRSAIFPAGHLANAAYWYNNKNGNFITSSYYMDKLPSWLINFNNQKRANDLLNLVWNPLLPIEKYVNSDEDNVDFEMIFKGKQQAVFPYDLKELRKSNDNFSLLVDVPYGNTILTEFAIAALKGENLGKGKETDFLAISYSSTDYIGHNFGIRSKEVEDTYVRMDREIASLLKALDAQVGEGNYTLFLTSDHACSDHPHFLKANRLPGEFFNSKKIKDALNAHLSEKFYKDKFVSQMDKTQVYIKDINDLKIVKEDVIKEAAKFLKTIEGVKEVFVPGNPEWNLNNSNISSFIKNSYNSKESGDIFYNMSSGWMEERTFGTTHGVSYNNDTHVPLLWFGGKIKKGESIKPHTITQIAPTLSFLFNIPLPNASNSIPVEELFE